MVNSKKGNKGFTLIELIIVFAIIAILAAILVPNFLKARSRSQLAACESNLKNLGTALELYSVDNSSRYPATGQLTAKLVPEYLKNIPKCPAAGSDTYSPGYTAAASPDAYSMYCGGNVHQQADISLPNYPQYTSSAGLIIK